MVPNIKDMAKLFTASKTAVATTIMGHFQGTNTPDMVDTFEQLHALGIRKKLPDLNKDLFLSQWAELYPKSISPNPNQLFPIFCYVKLMCGINSPAALRFPHNSFVDQTGPCTLSMRILTGAYPLPPHLPLGGEPFLSGCLSDAVLDAAVGSLTDKTIFQNTFQCSVGEYKATRGKKGTKRIILRILKYLGVPYSSVRCSKQQRANDGDSTGRPMMYMVSDEKWQGLLKLGILALPPFRDIIIEAGLHLEDV